MKILISGSNGLLGSRLLPFLEQDAHTVFRLVRSKKSTGPNDIYWNPAGKELDASQLEGIDAVIHLAGESISGGRWTAQKKARIRDSRVQGTELLSEALSSLKRPPGVLISASAMGFYGNRGSETLSEGSSAGDGFLAEICRLWEGATMSAQKQGIRVVHLRFGLILSLAGGAFAQLLPPFRLGLGGRIGDGKQYMSWVVLDEVLHIVKHALITEGLQGPVNVSSPNPVTNREFTKILGKVLGRPTIFPLPANIVRVLFGEMGDDLLLSSICMTPQQLQKTGYGFQYPSLEDAFRFLLKP
ncbi:MAG: TIGR01777 family protein [SAR324 cluster bacterium]|nr:TIGR01777 family protein [SAR324 cluster bacterium]